MRQKAVASFCVAFSALPRPWSVKFATLEAEQFEPGEGSDSVLLALQLRTYNLHSPPFPQLSNAHGLEADVFLMLPCERTPASACSEHSPSTGKLLRATSLSRLRLPKFQRGRCNPDQDEGCLACTSLSLPVELEQQLALSHTLRRLRTDCGGASGQELAPRVQQPCSCTCCPPGLPPGSTEHHKDRPFREAALLLVVIACSVPPSGQYHKHLFKQAQPLLYCTFFHSSRRIRCNRCILFAFRQPYLISLYALRTMKIPLFYSWQVVLLFC